jgi:hypothetical protein
MPALRTALQEELATEHKPGFVSRLRRALWPDAIWPRVAWAAAAFATLLIIGVYVVPHRTSQVAVALVSLRGGDDQPIEVPSGAPLQLELDRSGHDSSAQRVQIVDFRGSEVWSGQPQIVDGKLKASVPRGLSKGLYRVRTYNSSDLVNEYSLRAR